MAGTSNITGDESIIFADNASFDGTERGGKLTTNGQLWIGSTSSPHVKKGSITSPLGTLAIGYSSPNITLDLAGGAVAVEHLTGNTGGQLNPDGSNNFNIVTSNSTPVFAGSGSTLTLDFSLRNLALGSPMSAALLASVGNTALGNGFAGSGTLGAPLNKLTSGQGNVAIGWQSGANVIDGDNNTLVGQQAGAKITSGIQNNATGSTALTVLTTGSSNTANGQASLSFLLTGSNNVAIGKSSGSSYNGAESSNLLILNAGTNGENNTIRIGTQGSGAGQQNTCFIAGIVGVTSSNPVLTTINSSTGQLGVVASANNGVLVTSATGVPSILAGPGTTGNILQSNAAAAPSYSTATFPSTATGTGTILRANGTNWVATTSTYPNTNAVNTLLYASSANVMAALATANNSILSTDGSGVPSLGTSLSNDYTFTTSTSGATRTLTVSNTSNTSSSNALQQVTVAGTSAGDAFTTYTVSGTTNWSQGLDNSASDAFVLSASTALGTTNVISASTAGEVTMPLQPAFLAYLDTGVANVTGDGTVYTMIFDTEVFDQNSDFNLGTSTFTAPVTGRYRFDVGISLGGGTSISTAPNEIVTSNRTYQQNLFTAGTVTATFVKGYYSVFTDMDAADTVIFTIASTDSGGKIDDFNGTSGGKIRSWVSGSLVC